MSTLRLAVTPAQGGQVCWRLAFTGIDKPTSASIAKAPPRASGSPVPSRLLSRSAPAAPPAAHRAVDKIKAVLTNPGGFYVRSKTVKYPNGAIGGQLHG